MPIYAVFILRCCLLPTVVDPVYGYVTRSFCVYPLPPYTFYVTSPPFPTVNLRYVLPVTPPTTRYTPLRFYIPPPPTLHLPHRAITIVDSRICHTFLGRWVPYVGWSRCVCLPLPTPHVVRSGYTRLFLRFVRCLIRCTRSFTVSRADFTCLMLLRHLYYTAFVHTAGLRLRYFVRDLLATHLLHTPPLLPPLFTTQVRSPPDVPTLIY